MFMYSYIVSRTSKSSGDVTAQEERVQFDTLHSHLTSRCFNILFKEFLVAATMGKIKPSRASSERMRWNAQDGASCAIAQGPGEIPGSTRLDDIGDPWETHRPT